MIKNSIHGFNQAEAVNLKLTNDDLLILRWFVDFCPKMILAKVDGRLYWWINYNYLLECCPILDKQPKALSRFNINRLLSAKVLERITRKNAPEIKHKSGITAWFTFGENYIKLNTILQATPNPNGAGAVFNSNSASAGANKPTAVADIFLPNQGYKNTFEQGYKNTPEQGYKNTPNNSNNDICIKDNSNHGRARARVSAFDMVCYQTLKNEIPTLINNVQAFPPQFNATEVANRIKRSGYLQTHPKTTQWLIMNYEKILANRYDDRLTEISLVSSEELNDIVNLATSQAEERLKKVIEEQAEPIDIDPEPPPDSPDYPAWVARDFNKQMQKRG